MLRAARMQRRARARALAAFTQDAVPRLLRYVEETRREPLAVLGPRELIEELHRRRRFVLDEFGKESLKPGFFGGLAQQALTKTLSQLVGAERGAALVAQLTTGLEHDTTVEQNILLYRVAKGEATLDEFLAAYGHRAVNEMELAQPRWREDPAYVQRVLQSYRRPGLVPPDERHAQQVAARRQAEAELPALLAECGGSSLLEAVLPDLLDAQQLLPYRETGKHYLMMGYETLRAVLLELAGRWGLGRGLFFLHLDELERFEAERDQLVRAIAARQPGWRAAQSLSLQPVIDSEDLEELGRPRPRSDGTALAGRPLAAGSASGVARVLFDPQEAGDLGTGYILVCPSTDPGWTPLFVHARGLVVERGGLLSHGAIVARDFGIPAVACEGATERIPDGARVEIDGARGTVTLVAPRIGASE
jgi:pyruvate,water dikinase